jgi:general secretion pathway protein G
MTPKRSVVQRLVRVAQILFVVGGLSIVLLVALVLGGFGQTACSRVDRAKLDMGSISSALRIYGARTGMIPSTLQGLLPLAERGVLESVPRDPWGNPYEYVRSEDAVVLRSLGADGAPGGSGNDEDIVVRIPRGQPQEAL